MDEKADDASSTLLEPDIHLSLTLHPLSPTSSLSHVKRPSAGAVLLFAGTTRDNFRGRAVASLSYEAYTPLALRTMHSIAKHVLGKHSLCAISLTHRLGMVPIGEESILIAVSAPHRQAAWRAGEEALEECKRRLEIWKREDFVGDDGGEGERVWRANKEVEADGRPKERG